MAMAIDRAEIKGFLVFKGEFALDFCPGVNVIIGGNGTGKTTLIKVMYGLCESTKSLVRFENCSPGKTVVYSQPFECQIKIGDLFVKRTYDGSSDKIDQSHQFADSPLNAVFIPVAEMLSHSQGFLELSTKYSMPYDRTQISILVNAGLPVTREVTPNAANVLDKIGKIIEGEVLYEDGKYYILKHNGLKVEFSFEASGYQKFGLLWKLLRNGLLESGSVLFWDEPEASTNPGLMSVLVDILLELQRGGVQIFVATHNSNLAQLFDIKHTDGDSLLFCNLSKNDDGTIRCDSAAVYAELPQNVLEDADEALYKAVVARAMGVDADE
jgi:energy-coupling factor transporter ATP-binding protein EcfA2